MTFFRKNKNKILIIFLFLFLFTSNVILQLKYDKSVRLRNFYEAGAIKFILPPSVVKKLSFGFNNFLADVYWINIVQDLSDWDRSNDFYIEEYRNLATLDPYFSYPYLFGILTVTSKKYPKDLEKMEPVANIGIQNLPFNWEIPFYLGTGFNLTQNKEKALLYIKIASSRPIVPNRVQVIYDSLVKRTLSEEKTSQSLIKTIYETTESETTKKIIKNSMIINELTQTIRGLTNEYKNKYGKYPESIAEMIEHQMIQISPELEKNFTIIINKNTGDVEVSQKIDKK